MTRLERLRALIADEEISAANGATPQLDDAGDIRVDMATCGTCGMAWNDALITERTPAPSGRCPYEGIHGEIAELRRLERVPKRRNFCETPRDGRVTPRTGREFRETRGGK